MFCCNIRIRKRPFRNTCNRSFVARGCKINDTTFVLSYGIPGAGACRIIHVIGDTAHIGNAQTYGLRNVNYDVISKFPDSNFVVVLYQNLANDSVYLRIGSFNIEAQTMSFGDSLNLRDNKGNSKGFSVAAQHTNPGKSYVVLYNRKGLVSTPIDSVEFGISLTHLEVNVDRLSDDKFIVVYNPATGPCSTIVGRIFDEDSIYLGTNYPLSDMNRSLGLSEIDSN